MLQEINHSVPKYLNPKLLGVVSITSDVRICKLRKEEVISLSKFIAKTPLPAHLYSRKDTDQLTGCRWSAEEIRQNNRRLWNVVFFKDLYSLKNRISGHHGRIHEQHLSLGNIVRKSGVDNPSSVRLKITFHKDLSNANGSATISKSCLHRLSRSNYRYTTGLHALREFQSLKVASGRSYYFTLGVGELVEALFNHETD